MGRDGKFQEVEMSDSVKKLNPNFEDKTSIMTDPAFAPPALALEDDADAEFSFEEKTVVQTKTTPSVPQPPVVVVAAKTSPPPLEPWPKSDAPKSDAPTGSFKLPPPKLAAPDAISSSPMTAFTKAPGAVKIESKKESLKTKIPKFRFEKVDFAKHKKVVIGVGATLALLMMVGFYKSHQSPRHLDEGSVSSASSDAISPSVGGEMPTAEQVAARFETVFQKVQSDPGSNDSDVSR
jgi:hypothetical protein